MKAEKVCGRGFCYRQTTFGIVCPSSSAVPFLSVLCQLLTALLSPSSPYHGSFAAIPHKQSPSFLITLLKKLFLFFLTAPSSCATAELHWLVAHGDMACVLGTKSQLLCPPHEFDSDKIPSWIFSGLELCEFQESLWNPVLIFHNLCTEYFGFSVNTFLLRNSQFECWLCFA